MHGTRTQDGRDDDPQKHRAHPLDGEAALFEPILKVAIAEPEGDGQANAVGVNLEGSEVEGGRNWPHGSSVCLISQ